MPGRCGTARRSGMTKRRSLPGFVTATRREGAHEVWFEDARSAQAKFDAVKAYALAGVSYWALGYPYPQNWVLLEENFTVKKEEK